MVRPVLNAAANAAKLFLLLLIGLCHSTTQAAVSNSMMEVPENQNCPYGYHKEGHSCLKITKVHGGKWYGDNLRCNNGYVRLEEANGLERCHQLHEITNGGYEGPRIDCARGFVPVNWTCLPRSMIRDRSLIMSIDKFCPNGYQESSDSCIPDKVEKTTVVRELSIQGISLSMSEEDAFAELLSKNYEHFEDPSLISETRGFLKKETDGSFREVYLSTKGFPLAVYEMIYKQAFPNAHFTYSTVKQSIVQHFGSPDKISDFREREVFVYQDESSSRSPTLTISFPGNQVVMHMIWRNLEAQLIDQKRQEGKRLNALQENHNPQPVIKY